MASSYTGLGTELMTTGENAGTWGSTTNTNLQIIEQISGGYTAQSIAGGVQTTTLSVSDGSTGAVLAHRVIEFTGTITGNQTVTIPLDVQQLYVIKNGTSGAYTVNFKYASGSGSSVTWAATDKGTRLIYAAADHATNPNLVDSNIGGVGAVDLDGNELTLDADSDTSITASTDDQIDFEISGADDFTMTANAFNVLTGSHVTFADSANAKFGTGNDMLMYHDGSNSYITNAVGALKIATETSGIAVTIGHTTSETTIADNLTVTGTLTGTLATAAQGSVTSLGTLTTLTVDNIIVNGTTIGHTSDTDLLTLTSGVATVAGELDATTLDISGNADIDGTTNLDAVDIDGAVQLDATFTVGVDDQGYDVKLFGDTASRYWQWDTSADGVVQRGTLTVGVDDTGHDVKFFGATSGAYMLWDESTDDLVLAGAAKLYLYDAAGGEYLSSSGSALTIASGGTAWELPTSDGSANQLLKTDGSGNLDWTTVSGTITALNNQSANRLTTIGSTTTELDGEANLTFDGTDLLVGSAGKLQLRDTGLYVASNADGDLDIVSDGTAVDSINLESAGGITLDAGTASSGIVYEDDGTEMLRIHNSSSDVIVESKVSDKDIIFKVNDGGSGTEVARFDGDVSAFLLASGKKFMIGAAEEYVSGDGTDITFVVGSGGDINIGSGIGLTFGDDGEKIEGDGTDLTIAGNNINLTAVADVVIPANVGITFGSGEKIEGDSTDLTVTSGGAINLTATTDVVIPANVGITFGSGEKIEGDSTDLTVTSGGALNLTATTDVVIPANVGITFGSGEKIEGDSTDLTVTSGAKINLTATSDVVIPSGVGLILDGSGDEKIESDGTDISISVGSNGDINVPANVGVTFGDDGEKIEGDGTDLTISSSAVATIDAGTDIVLDADGADVFLKDGGTLFGTFTNSSGQLVIKSSSSGTTALTFSGANATFAGTLATAAGGFNVAGLDIDGATDIGADIVDADLFIIDDGAGGTNRKTTAARLKTYIGGGTSWQAVKTSNFTASAGQGVFVNTTSAAITITLPAGTIGDEVSIIDYAGTADTNNITIAANGSEKIHASTDDLTVATERAAFTLVFTDSTQGWLLKDK